MHKFYPIKGFKKPALSIRFLSILLLCLCVGKGWGQLTLPAGTSYTETFDAIGSGLPTGWTVRTGATASSRGTAQTFVTSPTTNNWASTTGAFSNMASSEGLTSTATAVAQGNASDRVPALRQGTSFGDPGAAFELQIANTTNKTGFSLSLKHQMLSVQPRSTTWTVQYSINGTSWTNLGTYTDPGTFGSTTGNYNFGNSLDNLSGNVYIRVVALSASTGSGNRDTYGIDDFVLSWTNSVSLPSVNLSVSSSSGSEAVASVITVTATASAAVTGNQTVDLAVSGTGITAGDYTLSLSTITIINGNTSGSVTFTVTDDALVEGLEVATLTISNPSSGITLGATTTQNIAITDNDGPEIEVKGNGNNIANNSFPPNPINHTDFGSVGIGSPFTRTYTIFNTGNAVLNISGPAPYVVVGGPNVGDFVVTTAPSNTVAAGGSTTFIVTFTPGAAGTRSATLTFNNDDADESPYYFSITGTGTANTITTTATSLGPFCNSSVTNITLGFSQAGSFTGQFNIQYSDPVSGAFPTNATSQLLTYVSNTATLVTATTPIGFVTGTGYRFRVVNNTPTYYNSGSNGSNVTVNGVPSITTDVSNASVPSGSTATFSVTAANAAGYQWQLNTGSGFNNIGGATSASYTTPATTVGMSGYQYQVIISGGACGNIISAVATLSVTTGSSIWTNPITGVDPNMNNPYTTGQVFNANITVSGIGRGPGITGNTATNRYNANGWNSGSFDANDYFYFTLTPKANISIDFINFIYTGQASPTGPQTKFAIRSSLDNYTANLATPPAGGTTLNLSGSAFQNITSAITFRVYAWGASAADGTYSIDDFTFNGTVTTACTATKLIFNTTISNTSQDNVLPAFLVSIACTDNTIITSCNSGTITLISTGCGLKGTLTKPVVNGVTTFNDIHFDRSIQTGVTLTATYSGTCGTYTDGVSNSFNVNFSGGAPTLANIRNEDFSGSLPAWAYTIGVPIYTNPATGSGTDVTGPKTFGTNNVMAKSFSVDNPTGSKGSTNTVTFTNVTGLAVYNTIDFSFQIGCVPVGPVGSGAGTDNGEFMYIECSLDAGASWSRILTSNGSSDHGFNLSAASPVNVAYNGNAIYSSGNSLWNQSAFIVSLPAGTTQFMFRMVANSNRTNENWVIDNLLLAGTTYGAGAQKLLPTITTFDINACPGSPNTISASIDNAIGTITYLWTPNTNISSTAMGNPTVNPLSTTTYTVVATDADKCVITGSVLVTVPSGAAGVWTGLVSKDFFNCLNWQDGVVPSLATDVNVNTTVNSIELDATSPFAGAFANTGTARNLVLNNNTIAFVGGSEKLNLTDLTLTTGASLNMTNGGTVNITGAWNNTVGSAAFTSGIGTINYAGSVAQTIQPENYYNLTSTASGNRLFPAGVVGIANVFNIGSNAYTFAPGGTVDYNGTAAQSVPAFDYRSLSLSNNNLKTIAGNTGVSDTLKLSGAASLELGAAYLTLKSVAAGTAMVAPVTTTATTPISYGSGRFVVERYFPNRRAWRLLTAPVSNTNNVYKAWQNGGNYIANSGTYVTKPFSTGTATDGLEQSLRYSLDTFNVTTGILDPVKDSKLTFLSGPASGTAAANRGYFMFVRGDRTLANLTPPNSNITTLRDTGLLQTSAKTFSALFPSLAVNSFMLIGNPYASPVDFDKISKTNIIARKFWAWDPRLNITLGAYVIVDGQFGNYIINPAPDPMMGTTGQDSIIQSSQAIFVQVNAPGNASVTFNENDKSVKDNNTVFRPLAFLQATEIYESLRANLYLDNADTAILADGTYEQYNNSFATGIDGLDGLKFTNILENLGITSNGKTLALERKPLVTENDTIFFKLWNTTERKYEFRFSTHDFNHPGLEGYLEDSYLKTSTPVDLNGYTNVKFSINDDAASKATNRFRIVFKQAVGGPLPVTFTAVKAYQQNSAINVEWKVENEINIKQYEVERSADGTSFTSIATVTATGSNSGSIGYQLPDENVTSGTFYYRIRSVSNDGKVFYSNIVKVVISEGVPRIYVYPNPVIVGGDISIHFINQPGGRYDLRLLNKLGQLIAVKQVKVSGVNSTQTLPFSKALAHGSYNLEIIRPDGSKKNVALIY